MVWCQRYGKMLYLTRDENAMKRQKEICEEEEYDGEKEYHKIDVLSHEDFSQVSKEFNCFGFLADDGQEAISFRAD